MYSGLITAYIRETLPPTLLTPLGMYMLIRKITLSESIECLTW